MNPHFNDLEIDSQSEDKFGILLRNLSNKGRLYNLHFDEYSKQTKEKEKYSYLFVADMSKNKRKYQC